MSNLLPLDGVLVPRSRLSSLNTIRTIDQIIGLVERTDSTGQNPEIWISGTTRHGLLTSNGSISQASFVSAFGFGTPPGTTNGTWHYAQAFFGGLGSGVGNYGITAAGNSRDTILVLYRAAGSSGVPQFSYLTSAPQCEALGSFDNYLIAWNVNSGGQRLLTRAQWCVRGSPSNWTGEGSGFEDLLEMKGYGTTLRPTPDGRFILWTDQQIWYGVGAAYPSQFQFAQLDPLVGCAAPHTIVWTPRGFLFLGSDSALRLLPREGGASQIVSTSVAKFFRRSGGVQISSGAVYDSATDLYHLFLTAASGSRGIVVNVGTGEWGFMDYGAVAADVPRRGLAVIQPIAQSHTGNEGLFFGTSGGTVFSTTSLASRDSIYGSVVTAAWRSGPIAADLAGNYKQTTKVCLDYVATSKSTVTVKISQDGGNNYEATGNAMSLSSAPVSGRVELDVYRGGAFPAIELTSNSTGFELHRLDVSMTIGGRK